LAPVLFSDVIFFLLVQVLPGVSFESYPPPIMFPGCIYGEQADLHEADN